MKKISSTELKLVEDKIKSMEYPTPNELWKALKDQMSESTFDEIIGHLLRLQHILINKENIIWIYGGKTINKTLEHYEFVAL